jgi:hypothetical protein
MPQISFQKNCYLNVYDNGHYDIIMDQAGYYNCYPSVDGIPVSNKDITLFYDTESVVITYKTLNFNLILHFLVKDQYLSLLASLDKIKIDRVEKLSVFDNACLTGVEKLLAHGYFSWDQSFLYEARDVAEAEASALGVVLSSSGVALTGYLTHDKMFQTFIYRTEGNQFLASSEMYLEGKDLREIKSVDFSEIVFFAHDDLDLAQKKWADLVIRTNGIRLSKPTTTGWCSWYYDYFWFSGEILERHLEKFAPYRKDLNLNVFVIDANHFEHLGDWLYPDSKFQKGMDYYARAITEAGYIPGIWIGPWMVAERSRLFHEHQDWLCRDQAGELIEFMNPLGEDNVWGYRSKIHYCLDTSNPEAFEYIRNVFRTYRKWGFKYFKTDFMFWGSMDRFEGGWYHDGLNKHNLITDKEKRPLIRRHTPGRTRMEYFTDVLKMIREEIGRESIWLGCGQPIWASAGYVDCMRVSRDVGARWVAHNSPKELLNDLALRNFTNHRFYEVDPDCVLLRTWETKITEAEATSLALYMGVAQGMIMTSDYVDECPQHRLDLFKFLAGDNNAVEFRPLLLGRETDLVIYGGTRKDNAMSILFFFNNGETPVNKSYPLALLGVTGTYAVRWKKEDDIHLEGMISVCLNPHESALFYIQDKPFEKGWQPVKITG